MTAEDARERTSDGGNAGGLAPVERKDIDMTCSSTAADIRKMTACDLSSSQSPPPLLLSDGSLKQRLVMMRMRRETRTHAGRRRRGDLYLRLKSKREFRSQRALEQKALTRWFVPRQSVFLLDGMPVLSAPYIALAA